LPESGGSASVASIGRVLPDLSRQITGEETTDEGKEGRSITEYSETDDPGQGGRRMPRVQIRSISEYSVTDCPSSSTNWRH